MQLKVHSIHFDADQKLLAFIREKVDKLIHFYSDILGGEVFLRLEKSKDTQNKVVHIKIEIPGSALFVKEQCRTFEEATDLAVEALRSQIVRHKEKIKKL